MLTQSAPAIVNALSGQLPDNAVKSLLQAIGNCSQPLTQRGAVNFQPPGLQQSGPGTYGKGAWNPADYPNVLPNASQAGNLQIVLPGWGGAGGSNSRNFYGDTFNFPTSQQFALNNYYGGPNVYNGGNSYVENSYSTNNTVQNQYVQNLYVQTLNGQPLPGAPGLDGVAGFNGQNGLDGKRGDAGAAGQAGVNGANGLNGQQGIGLNGLNGAAGMNGLNAVLPPPKQRFFVAGVRAPVRSRRVVRGVSFDPDTCQLTVQKLTIRHVTSVTAPLAALRYYGP